MTTSNPPWKDLRMDEAELQRKLDDIFDQGLLFHCFTDYQRDYEAVIYCTADPRTGIQPAYLRYLFKFCVQARTETAIPPEIWTRSLDDRLITYETRADHADGYLWGVRWQCLYPGASIVSDSATAADWASKLGLDFHEVSLRMNGHTVNLVFSDLEVTEVGPGYSPLMVETGGPDFKIPLP